MRGALWMTGAAAALATMNGMVRFAAEDLHPMQIAFFRNLFGLFFMLPWLVRVGLPGLATRRLGLHTVRGVISLAAMLCWFGAITVLPLAEAVAISFTAPLIAAAGAAVILREQVGIRRWSAILLGFVGVLIVIRPGLATVTLGSLLALGAALGFATSMLMVKSLSRSETSEAIVTYMALYLTTMSLFPALFVWQAPPAALWPWFVAMGALGTAGHLCMTRAFAATETTIVLPFDYLRLPFVAVIGFAFFAQVPDIYTWTGGALIAGASAYVAHREARLARAPQVEAMPEPAPELPARVRRPEAGE